LGGVLLLAAVRPLDVAPKAKKPALDLALSQVSLAAKTR